MRDLPDRTRKILRMTSLGKEAESESESEDEAAVEEDEDDDDREASEDEQTRTIATETPQMIKNRMQVATMMPKPVMLRGRDLRRNLRVSLMRRGPEMIFGDSDVDEEDGYANGGEDGLEGECSEEVYRSEDEEDY
ncbi:hypothetical protein K458DRAFT_388117 [Lentithecium fluviatile CBS 122367]|uniref:Uncharacterized protein n=1 Tax=Lentithecium fluviatile CBS 122367 TaxID=1168545 RepID=A0A6G1J4R4_9PLEO|nr:hypothetical protein K458DRAFT_388117 [Lentithecium fluviatile CBS 122367]